MNKFKTYLAAILKSFEVSDRTNLNPFSITLNQSQPFEKTLREIRYLIGGRASKKSTHFPDLPEWEHYGIFNYLLAGPVHLACTTVYVVCMAVSATGILVMRCASSISDWLDKDFGPNRTPRESWLLALIKLALLIVVPSLGLVITFLGLLAYMVSKVILQPVDYLVQNGLMPVLELAVLPVSLLLATITHTSFWLINVMMGSENKINQTQEVPVKSSALLVNSALATHLRRSEEKQVAKEGRGVQTTIAAKLPLFAMSFAKSEAGGLTQKRIGFDPSSRVVPVF